MRSFLRIRYIILLFAGISIAYYFYSNATNFRKENRQLTSDIQELKTEFINLRIQEGEIAFAAQEIAKIDEQRDEIKRELNDLRSTLEKEGAVVDSLQRELTELFEKQRLQLREEARGRKFEKMTTPEGRTYENIEIMEVRPDGVSFRFGDGASAAGLGLHQLSDDWIEYFMYTDAEVNKACAEAGVKPRK